MPKRTWPQYSLKVEAMWKADEKVQTISVLTWKGSEKGKRKLTHSPQARMPER